MHRALSLSAATLALSALLPSFALAQTATYTLSYSCTAYSGVTARDLPLRDFGGTARAATASEMAEAVQASAFENQ